MEPLPKPFLLNSDEGGDIKESKSSPIPGNGDAGSTSGSSDSISTFSSSDWYFVVKALPTTEISRLSEDSFKKLIEEQPC